MQEGPGVGASTDWACASGEDSRAIKPPEINTAVSRIDVPCLVQVLLLILTVFQPRAERAWALDQSCNDLGAVSLIPASAAEGRNTNFTPVIGLGSRPAPLAINNWPHLPSYLDKLYDN